MMIILTCDIAHIDICLNIGIDIDTNIGVGDLSRYEYSKGSCKYIGMIDIGILDIGRINIDILNLSWHE